MAKGQKVILGISAANRDMDIWGADAEQWKPERWFSHSPVDDSAAEKPTVRIPEAVAGAKFPSIYSGM